MAYYTLLQRDELGFWSIQFGDKDKATVEYERDEYRYGQFLKAKDLKIIKTKTSRHGEIYAAVATLNGVAE